MVTIASGYSMITAKKALQMLKMKLTYGLPAAVFASVTPADSHKLVWAAVCLAGGCLLHEVVMTSFLPLVLAGIVV